MAAVDEEEQPAVRAGDVIEYLRKGSRGEIDFDAAAAAEDMSSCLAYLLEQ